MKVRTMLILFGLKVCLTFDATGVLGQATSDTKKSDLIGVWGMFKDKHPDGWGSFDPPYEYLQFTEDGKYNRTYIHKKAKSIIFGNFKVINDSLVVFYESIGTDGAYKGTVATDTSRLYSLDLGLMQLWEDWDRILWKSIKKWGHRKKYRHLTETEKEKLEAVRRKLLGEYALIKGD